MLRIAGFYYFVTLSPDFVLYRLFPEGTKQNSISPCHSFHKESAANDFLLHILCCSDKTQSFEYQVLSTKNRTIKT